MLTALEGAIKREYLASDYETTSELLGSVCSSSCLPNDTIGGGRIPVLPWVPYTTAAVALRLMELDTCAFYTSQQKLESKDKKVGIVVVSFHCSPTLIVNYTEKKGNFVMKSSHYGGSRRCCF
jgi:hypothetical protein